MPYSVGASNEATGLTYAISGDDFPAFLEAWQKVDGLDGFIQAVGEMTADRAVETVKDAGLGPQHVEAPADELADLIRNCPDTGTLTALYKAHKAEWNAQYNDMAAKRKKELSK